MCPGSAPDPGTPSAGAGRAMFASAPLDLLPLSDHGGELLVFRVVHRVGVVVIGERALFHFLDVFPDAADCDFGELGEALGELRLEVGENAEQVVAEQYLPIGADPGP